MSNVKAITGPLGVPLSLSVKVADNIPPPPYDVLPDTPYPFPFDVVQTSIEARSPTKLTDSYALPLTVTDDQVTQHNVIADAEYDESILKLEVWQVTGLDAIQSKTDLMTSAIAETANTQTNGSAAATLTVTEGRVDTHSAVSDPAPLPVQPIVKTSAVEWTNRPVLVTDNRDVTLKHATIEDAGIDTSNITTFYSTNRAPRLQYWS